MDARIGKTRKQALDYTVYLFVRIFVCVIQGVSIEFGYSMARCLAYLAYAADRRHREVAVANLKQSFGDEYTEAQRRQIVLDVYVHFLRMIVEMAHIPRKLHYYDWRRMARLENAAPLVRSLMDDSRPTIVVTGHFGNWEMAGFLLAAIGVESHAIARDLDNPYLHDFVKRFRQWSGQTILSKTGDFDRIQKVLVDRGVLISVGDQSAGPRGHFVDFFGRPASTHKAIALLAMQHDAQIVVGYAYRDRPNFHYTIRCERVLDPRDYENQPNGAFHMTQDFTAQLERAIRRAPEQYLWLHNRWKHEPPAKSARADRISRRLAA